jgi:hypothetical protein
MMCSKKWNRATRGGQRVIAGSPSFDGKIRSRRKKNTKNVKMVLDSKANRCNTYYMTNIKGKPTMTYLLRQAISETDSFRAIETATGVKRQSLMKFVRGEQSLRLDMADTLAAHFCIECRRMRRKAR